MTSRPYLLIVTLRDLWHSHPKNEGRKYGGTSRDFREAKEWLQVNDWEPGDVTELSQRFNRYMADTFEAWEQQDYPLWAFLRHYGRYAPPRGERIVRRSTYHCPECGQQHPISEPCKVRRLA